MKVNIGTASKEFGVAQETLRRWERLEKIEVERTPKGHRRYDLSKLRNFVSKAKSGRYTIAYARVSSHDQKKDFILKLQHWNLFVQVMDGLMKSFKI